MFGLQRSAVADPPNPWKVPASIRAREVVIRRQSRGGFLLGVLSSAALVAGFIGITSSASAANSPWTLFNYNSSDHGLKATAAASAASDTASFNFAPGVYTAALTTSAKALTGDLTGDMISATVAVTNMGPLATFIDQHNGGCLPDNQSVRLYFSSAGTGSAPPIPPITTPSKGYYTTFWWSNPISVVLTNNASGAMSAALDPTQWSDWNGQPGTAVPDAFATAVSKVTSIGLSFGGGCFFENGVTTSDGSGTFTLSGFSVT
jgi:hypothetical protein